MHFNFEVSYIYRSGEYLGYDPDYGYIYSVFINHTKDGKKRYAVIAVKNNEAKILIIYKGTK